MYEHDLCLILFHTTHFELYIALFLHYFTSLADENLISNIGLASVLSDFWFRHLDRFGFKVHIFWEGHKILQNLHLNFDCM